MAAEQMSPWLERRNQLVRRLLSFLLGRPLASAAQHEHRLPILLALPVFASDALSSVAYATEEVLIQFRHQGASPEVALHFLLPICIAIAILVLIVGSSYRQAIHLYPTGGGSYSVARDNLGALAGMTAGAALTVDYILTVAVSVSSGVQYLVATLPALRIDVHVPLAGVSLAIPATVLMAVALVLFIAYINMRGTRESGWMFAFPAYGFMAMLGIVLVASVVRAILGSKGIALPAPDGEALAHSAQSGVQAVGLIVVLRAFSSGCSALTGVEAVSNGVSAFQVPEAKNASKTLLILMIALVVLNTGVGWAATYFGVVPQDGTTVISQIAAANFGTELSWGAPQALVFHGLNVVTLLVLMIAANASFAGLPRLLALVAKDGYAPRAFMSLGDRLVHSRGIAMLTVASCLLIVAFRAEVTALIPLYAVGVFVCFTLSQLGMVVHIRDLGGVGWQRTAALNLVGALVTGTVAIVQAVSKFTEGAWMVVVVLPLLVLVSWRIRKHYEWFDRLMTVDETHLNPLEEEPERTTVLVLISSDIHRGTLEGLECGRVLAGRQGDTMLRAVHIEMNPASTPRLLDKWQRLVEPHLGSEIRLDVVESPYRWLLEPLMDYLDRIEMERPGDRIFLVMPEFETGSWVTQLLHNFTARRLRSALFDRANVTVVNSRYFMTRPAWRTGRRGLVT